VPRTTDRAGSCLDDADPSSLNRDEPTFKPGPFAADTPGMTTRTRRRRLAAAAVFLATAMGVAAAADGNSAPSAPSMPSEIGDAVSVGGAVLLSE
jgi:hypothetical protein